MAKVEESAAVVVCDAGPLIHLDELESLDLLGDFPEVLVPDAVWREAEKHRPTAFLGGARHFQRVALERGSASPLLRSLIETMNLHLGEQEALGLAEKHPGAVFLTDDAAARLAAGAMGIEARGTTGLLIRSIRRGLRTKSEVLALLRSIPEVVCVKFSKMEAVGRSLGFCLLVLLARFFIEAR